MSLFDSASLVVTPNGYKEDKLYSIKPTDGSGDLVVTRATTATRVNSAGLIEQVAYNLLTYSEQFDNADWGKEFTTITANNIISPNGIQTADRFNLGSGTEQKFIYQGVTQNGTYTQSVYLKKGTHTFVQLATGGDVNPYCNFDLTNGTFAAFGSTATMTNVGNEWYRCTMTYTSSIATFFYIFAANSLASARTPATSSTGNFYAWGAQLVTGTSAKEYFPTTDRLNVPRLDYTNSSCPSILVEPQRTNLALRSQEFDNADWTRANTSITANQLISPDGNLNSDIIIDDSTNDRHIIYQSFIGDFSTARTFSTYAKQGSLRYLVLSITSVNDSASCYSAIFDLQTGTITATKNNGTATINASIQNAGNGWYRCIISGTLGIGVLAYFPIIGTSNRATFTGSLANNNIPVYVGSGQNLYLYGAQLEAGSYATSYIPTVASSVTRNTDNIYKTGISSLIGQTEGTVFIDFIWNQLTGIGSYPRIIELWKDSGNYIQLFNISGTQTFYYEIYNGGVVQFSGSTTMNLGANKIALAYKLNDCVIYKNGALIASDNVATIPTLNDLGIFGVFNGGGGANLAASLKSAQLYKTRLTNTELASLTTL